MSAGTKYTTKTELLDAVIALVYSNTTNQVSADGAQTALLDLAESLWGGSSAITVITDYADLINLIGSETLDPGSIYQFEYQCIHEMPHTTVLNIDSPNYVTTTETFYAEALSSSTLSPIVVSKAYPQDLILIDFLNDTAEDGAATARTGKVMYRRDQDTGNETAYDFRGVYFRKYAIDYTDNTITTNFVIGSNAVKDELILYSGALYKAGVDITAWNGDTFGWLFVVDNISSGVQWIGYDNFPVANILLPADLTDFVDATTFTGVCTGISIGQTSSNNGYNAIIVKTSTYLTLSADSLDSYIDSSNYNFSTMRMENSLYMVATDCTANSLTGVVIRQATASQYGNLTQGSINGGTGFKLEGVSNNISVAGSSYNSIGDGAGDLAIYLLNNSTIRESCFGVHLINVVNVAIGTDFSTSTVMGIDDSTIGNNVSNIDLQTTANNVLAYTAVTIGNNSTNFTGVATATLNSVVFGPTCSNITLDVGAYINDSHIGAGCTDFELGTTAFIERSTFRPAFKGLIMASGTLITDCTFYPIFSTSAYINLTMEGTSGFYSCVFGFQPTYAAFDNSLGNLAVMYTIGLCIYSSGDFSALSVAGSTATIQYSSFGTSTIVAITTGVIINSSFGNDTNITDNGSTTAGSLTQVSAADSCHIVIVDGDSITSCRLESSVELTVDGKAGVSGFAANVSSCTFTPNWAGTLQGHYTSQDWTNSTAGGTYDPFGAGSIGGGFGTIGYTSGASAYSPIFSNLDPEIMYSISFTANQSVTLDKEFLPENRKVKMLLNNGTGGVANLLSITLFDSGDAPIVLSGVGATTYIEVIRVVQSVLSIDHVVITFTNSIV
jgi:hypothetical protein